ncbi:MAG: hypothetical protein ABW098_14690 [Candidatus Thiodiazotropha sp.]
MDVAEISPYSGLSPRKLTFAVVISIGFHLLMLLYLSNWLQQQRDISAPSSLPRPLSITITTPGTTQASANPQAASIEPATTRNQESIQQTQMPSSDEAQAELTSDRIREKTVTSAQIMRSAPAITQDLAKQTEEVERENTDTVSAILQRALNKPRETPGVSTQADGTIRVVTENGFTYCVKPLDDWRIIDPEDDLRVSVYCK